MSDVTLKRIEDECRRADSYRGPEGLASNIMLIIEQGRAAASAPNGEAGELIERLADWQPIETAPKDGSVIFLTSTSDLWKYPFPAKWEPNQQWWAFADEPLNYSWAVSELVTHWMPLPEPPKDDQ